MVMNDWAGGGGECDACVCMFVCFVFVQMENERLYEREVELRQREMNVEEMEAMVRDSHSLLEKCAEQEVNKRWTQMTEVSEASFCVSRNFSLRISFGFEAPTTFLCNVLSIWSIPPTSV